MGTANLEHVNALIAACKGENAARNEAISLCLLDTGVRTKELYDTNLGDIDMGTRAITIRQDKGRKTRAVFIGR